MFQSTGVARSPLRHERRFRRFKLRFPVHLLVQNNEGVSELDAVSRDVSIGGLLLECPVRIPVQSPVNFVISLRSRSTRALELVGNGKVVRVETTQLESNVAIAVECNTPITQIERYLVDHSS